MIVIAIAAFLCCLILAMRLSRVEGRLESLEQWAGDDAHAWITFEPDDEE